MVPNLLLLGFPPTTWIIVPLLAFPIGILLLYILRGNLILRIWALGEAFFFIRLCMESQIADGRPDRVMAAMVMFSLYMLFVGLGVRVMTKRYGNPLE